MRKTLTAVFCGLVLFLGTAIGQQGQTEYLDILSVKVRPDKLMEYENAIKKLVELNRKNGDHWVAFSTEYGDSGRLYFSSLRQSMGEIETGMKSFEAALKEGLGPAGFAKMMYDLNAMSESSRAEIRRRAWSMSVNAPATPEERMKMVAGTRWIRSLRINLKPGRGGEFVEAWKPWQEALSKLDPKMPVLVSSSVTGPPVIYAAMYLKSLGDIDSMDKAVRELVNSETYRNFQKSTADLVSMTSWELHRMRPELSNPPEQLVKLDPAFWAPKQEAGSETTTRKKRK